jgi:acetyl esterase/lipase
MQRTIRAAPPGDLDIVGGGTLTLSARLELAAAGVSRPAAAVPVELDVYEGMPHGFPLLPIRTAAALLARVAEFVDGRIEPRRRRN